jgi:membrane associated rhomboid family serine protease
MSATETSTTETRYCYRHPDRPTGLSCSECGRPICTECMTPAAVGIRCPEHAGAAGRAGARRARRPVVHVPRAPGTSTQAPVTKTLIGINALIFLVTLVQGSGGSPGGSLYLKMVLFGPWVGQGDWWRLVTAMFLHASFLHIGFNMLALWWIGAPVEGYLGTRRYLGLYFVSGLAGAAGALLQSPTTPVVGASGAIFGILGAMLILEYQATGSLAGNAMTWIVINLVLSFTLSNISFGGHIGGLIGGILVTLAYAHDGRRNTAYGGLGAFGVLGLVAVGAASVAVAYLQVRGYA